MLPDTTPELTQDQIDQLEQARKMIPLVRKQLQRAKLAGLDMAQQEADLNASEAQIDKLYRVYVKRLAPTPRP